MAKRFVSVGECMVEFSGGEGGMYRMGFAGDTLNTIWYARARLPDSWRTDYVTALGEDSYSTQIREFLNRNGIGTDAIQTIPGRRPGLYTIMVKDGDRHFTYWRDASAARMMAEDREALFAALEGADLVYFSGISLAILQPRARGRLLKAIIRARDAGATIAFDPNARPALWKSKAVMAAVHTVAASISDIVLPTFPDEQATFGDPSAEATARRYLDLGVREVVVKDGSSPAIIGTADGLQSVPASSVEVVDPTGAGDSFNGAYLAARLTGADAVSAVLAGHRVASIVVGHRGALVDPALVK